MNKYIFLIVMGFLMTTNCSDDFFDQVVDVEIPEHTPALAITSNLNNVDSILWVYVSSSVGILVEEDPSEITDAIVELHKNGSLLYTLPHLEQGVYAWEAPEPLGNEIVDYEIKVSKPGFESVSSIQTMPLQVDIINATFEKEGTISTDGDRVDEIIIEFDDPKDIANYYKVSAKLEFTGDDGEFYEYDIYLESHDPSVVYTNDGLYLSDGVFDGERYEFSLYSYSISDDEFMNDTKISVSLVNVSKDRFFRESSLEASENSQDNPFAEPAVIFSNIENGYGIFSLEAMGPIFKIEL